jgi:hypothetical protein
MMPSIRDGETRKLCSASSRKRGSINMGDGIERDGPPSIRSMQRNDADQQRSKARQYRERADREVHDSVITEAFYQIAATLERRALMRSAAVLEMVFEIIDERRG